MTRPVVVLSLFASQFFVAPAYAVDGASAIDTCRDFSLIAQEVMSARQRNVLMSETLPNAIERVGVWAEEHGHDLGPEGAEEAAAMLVIAAYDTAVYPSDSDFDGERQIAISEFENHHFAECYKGLRSSPAPLSQAKPFRQPPKTIEENNLYPSIEALAEIEAGFCSLPTTSVYSDQLSEEAEYSISHVAVDLIYDGYGTKLQAGIARSGVRPIGVYFDYNSDGEIDSDMAIDFVREIPFIGRRLADAYDPVVAQNLYSIFVMERENAACTSAKDMATATSEKSSMLWNYVMDNYDALAEWIGSIAAEDTSDQSATDDVREKGR